MVCELEAHARCISEFGSILTSFCKPVVVLEPAIRCLSSTICISTSFKTADVLTRVMLSRSVSDVTVLVCVCLFVVTIKPKNPYLASSLGLEEKPLGVYPLGPRLFVVSN